MVKYCSSICCSNVLKDWRKWLFSYWIAIIIWDGLEESDCGIDFFECLELLGDCGSYCKWWVDDIGDII
jgi:hypothetical protein